LRQKEKPMASRLGPIIGLYFMASLLIGETALVAPYLGERIAVHFDAAGRPNGWASPSALIRDVSLVSAFLASIFLGAGLLQAVPAEWFNVPCERYWLAPERRSGSIAFMRDWIRWCVVLTMALFVGVLALLLNANVHTPPKMSAAVFGVLIVYLGASVAMLCALIWRFRRRD
jgi:hypothetical protein